MWILYDIKNLLEFPEKKNMIGFFSTLSLKIMYISDFD